jgi:arylsulfatase
MKGLKGSTDEGGVHVPFFLRWPGKIAANKDIPTLAAHIDVFPTLAALTGAPLPENQVEGRSLLPLLEGNTTDWKDRHIFAHICRWPTGAEPNNFRDINFTVRNQRYRYVGASRSEAKAKKAKSAGTGPALYDMEADPAQTQNIIADQPEIAAQMKAAYDQYWKEARPLMVNESAPMSPTKPYHEWFNKQKATTGIPPWIAPKL